MEVISIRYMYDGQERLRDVRIDDLGDQVKYHTNIGNIEVTFSAGESGNLTAESAPQLIDKKMLEVIAESIENYFA